MNDLIMKKAKKMQELMNDLYELKDKLNRIGQELDCQIIDNARYKIAINIAAKEIAMDKYLLHGDDLDERAIKKIVQRLLLKAKDIDRPVGQYTGREDKNGKEAYAGDRISYLDNLTGVIIFSDYYLGFFVQPEYPYVDGEQPLYEIKDIEIIGNIRQAKNPLEPGA